MLAKHANNNQQVIPNIARDRLISLIEFAQQTARLKLSPVTEAPNHGIFHRYEHDLIGLPGIHFNTGSDEDEIWLTIERLLESHPPKPKETLLQQWLELSNKPEYQPKIKRSIEIDSGYKDDKSPEKVVLLFFVDYEKREFVERVYQNYLTHQWKPWADEEKRRRRTIKLYTELFTLKQQLEGSISDAQIELVWGVGIGLLQTKDSGISYPLITHLVEVILNKDDMSIDIRPREIEPRLELEAYLSIDNLGVEELEKSYKELVSKQPHIFSPFDRISYEPQLKLAVMHLDPEGIYWPDQTTAEDRHVPKKDSKLIVTDTWMIFARPRSKSLFIQDLENFKNQFSDAELEITNVISAIVTEPQEVHIDKIFPNFRGLSNSGYTDSSGGEVNELFFPMPYNEEQVSIIQKLECSEGVVVQGPPGTGKTHTIANIIAHYMANGKRVLVTSMKEPALTVLKEKLPESIRPLAVSLLTNEQDGMKQFEYAISKIANELQAINRGSLSSEISRSENYIDQLHGKLSLIDRSIGAWAKKNIEPILLDGDTILPEAAAREISQNFGNYEWLEDDITIGAEYTPKFINNDIVRLREARRNLGIDLVNLNAKLPEIDIFPESNEILKIHASLSKYNELKALLEKNEYPSLVNNSDETIAHVCDLLERISDLCQIQEALSSSSVKLIDSIEGMLSNANSDQLIQHFELLAVEIDSACLGRNEFIVKPVYLPSELEITDDIVQAIINKTQGKSAFGLAGLIGKGAVKRKIEEIKILNAMPKNNEEWRYVYKYILFLREASNLIIRWNSIASEVSLTCLVELEAMASLKLAKEELDAYRLVRERIKLEKLILSGAKTVCPSWTKHTALFEENDTLEVLKEILVCHFNCYNLSKSWAVKEQLQNLISVYSGAITESIKSFINDNLGNPSISEFQIQGQWSQLMAELRRILGLRNYLEDVNEISQLISESGAIKWADRLSLEHLQSPIDHLLPDNWQQAWRLRRLANHLISSSQFNEFKTLTMQRLDVDKQLSKTYQEVVSKRTWLKMSENATPDIKAALQAFQTAISRIGRGVGKRAVRYRRDARSAAKITNKAIPCWIMPHYRVSESLPPEFGCFDLVIIDEASQSDLSALPSLLRAKKLLVVGDDKQVSPEGVGLEEEKILNLMSRYLSNQVELYKQAMSPERSIYDLCKIIFSESHVMLREHFRSVSCIIEYSKREFYNHELKPLRLPKKSERLDPPLIDVLVEDGFRVKKSKFNLPEARFIVDEIIKICADPIMENRTIGVVSLLGNEQSKEIWGMLEVELGPDEITKHQITCGDALTFQGKERDIMFLSMVATKDSCTAYSGRASEQRFNVAASRARDRMYLVRSLEIDDLSHKDVLRRRLIEHFTSPFAQDEMRTSSLRDLCESGFELEVYDLLTERGYRVIPQVEVGRFRIDMVVEGHNDTRLAIECDGDRYHDASRWEDDMNRQRVLERAGWYFWRCFASTFVLYKDNVINGLIETLTERGIEPVGSDGMTVNIHCEHRKVKNMTLDLTDNQMENPTSPEII